MDNLNISERPERPTMHVHLYGPPGIGKSGLAMVLAAKLNLGGESVELVQEYAKELLWGGMLKPENQALTTSEQLRREMVLRGKVDFVVTDSPPLLGVVYAVPQQVEPLRICVGDITRKWDHVSYFLHRDLGSSYQQLGRNESAEQSAIIGRKIERLLIQTGIPYKKVDLSGGPGATWDLADTLIDDILSRYNEMAPERNRRPLRELRIPPRDFAASEGVMQP